MKRILPYILIFALILPQLSLLGKIIIFSKPDKAATVLFMGLAEEEEDASKETESEGKKFVSELLFFEDLLPGEKTHNDFFCRYVNYYDFFYSNITIPPPRIS